MFCATDCGLGTWTPSFKFCTGCWQESTGSDQQQFPQFPCLCFRPQLLQQAEEISESTTVNSSFQNLHPEFSSENYGLHSEVETDVCSVVWLMPLQTQHQSEHFQIPTELEVGLPCQVQKSDPKRILIQTKEAQTQFGRSCTSLASVPTTIDQEGLVASAVELDFRNERLCQVKGNARGSRFFIHHSGDSDLGTSPAQDTQDRLTSKSKNCQLIVLLARKQKKKLQK